MPVLLFLRALGMGVGSWLSRRSLIELASIALALFAGVQTIRATIDHRSLGKANQRITELTQLRKADRASYEAAQRQAAANNQAHITQIEKQQDAINEKTRSDYSRDLDRLRAQSRTAQGSPGGSKAPGVPKAAPGADGKAGVPLSTPELLRAAELELQLDKLIDWVNQESQVER